MIIFFNNIKNVLFRFLILFTVFIIPEFVIAASIEATDAEGNIYTLHDDGTYKKNEKKRLSDKEMADGIVAVIVTFKKIYDEEVTQEEKECLHKMVLDNTGIKWNQLNRNHQTWEKMVEWIETLPINEGLVTDEMAIAGNIAYTIGPMETAGKYCGILE